MSGKRPIIQLPVVVTDVIFSYLTDKDAHSAIKANRKVLKNLKKSCKDYKKLPKCWDCWENNEITVYDVNGVPQSRDGACKCEKK